MRQAFDAAGTPADAAWAAYQLGSWSSGAAAVGSAEWYHRGLELAPAYVPNLAGLAKVAWARGADDLAIPAYGGGRPYPSAEYVTRSATCTRRRAAGPGRASSTRSSRRRATSHRANGVNVDLEVALFDADHGDPARALVAARDEWARRRSIHVADAYAWALHANGRDADGPAYRATRSRLGTRNASSSSTPA